MRRSGPYPRMIGPSAIVVSLSRAWPTPTTLQSNSLDIKNAVFYVLNQWFMIYLTKYNIFYTQALTTHQMTL